MTTAAPPVPQLSMADRRRLRLLVELYYDVQGIRIASENKIDRYAEVEALASLHGEEKIEELRRQGTEVLHKLIEGFKEKTNPNFGAYGLLVDNAKKMLMQQEYMTSVNLLMRNQEAIVMNQAKPLIQDHPIWLEWLSRVRGIGPVLAGGIIARIPIERSPHVSQLWKYAGFGVTIDKWVCPVCKHVIEHAKGMGTQGAQVFCPDCKNVTQPQGHADRPAKGEKLGYNPKLKVLIWKVVQSFIKQDPKKSKYRQLYEHFRAEYEERPCTKTHYNEKKEVIPCFDAHKHAKAGRKVGKIFLAHLYLVWRKIMGLPVSDPWVFWAKGGAHDKASYLEPLYDRASGEEAEIDDLEFKPLKGMKTWKKKAKPVAAAKPKKKGKK